MSLHQLENDRTPAYTPNVTTAPTHNLSLTLAGRDSVKLPEEIESSLTDTTDTLGSTETSEVEVSVRRLENDRTTTYTSIDTTAPTHNLQSSGSETLPEETESLLVDTLGVVEKSEVATPSYIYYRIYAEDGAIPSKTPATPDDPFVGRITARSVPPPHAAESIKYNIAKVEDIKDHTSTILFLTSYSPSPMDDTDKVTIFNRTGPGSTPQEPLALVAKISNSERSALESGERGGLTSAVDSDTMPSEIRYLYYRLYADKYEIPSKIAFDPEHPSLGRIRADSITPPHSPVTIKRCISRVEKTPALANADLFADISCNTPLKKGYISILRTYGPMAIVQMPIIQINTPSVPDGRYAIKNGAEDIYWYPGRPFSTLHFIFATKQEESRDYLQWDITHGIDGNISMTSPFAPSLWVNVVGTAIAGSTVPVPWRLIPAGGKFYYLTTDMNRFSRYPLVPTAYRYRQSSLGVMATLKEGDPCQMWEFIRVYNKY